MVTRAMNITLIRESKKELPRLVGFRSTFLSLMLGTGAVCVEMGRCL